jgi:ammonium transporter, Amt family
VSLTDPAGCKANSSKVKFWLQIDDSLDVFAEHGVGGWLGLLATGLFSAPWIIGLDGVNANPELWPGGWINHNYKQLYKQLAYALAASVWSFGISIVLALMVDRIPGLKLRASEEAELLGMDDDQLGEFAYDYVEIRRDYLAWTPAVGGDNPHNPSIEPHAMYGIPEHSEMIAGTALKDVSEAGESAPLPEKEKSTERIVGEMN